MASVSGGDCKLKPSPSKDPELSLSWCLSKLPKKPHSPKDLDKRAKMAQWRALVAIRTHHIKGHRSSISRFRREGGLGPLLELLKQPDCNRKTLDLALSILGNCCTERETCAQVRKLDGINIIVDIMRRQVALVSVQNRAARALGNLAMDPENSARIHAAGGVPLLLLCVSQSSSPSSSPSSSSSPGSFSPSPPSTPDSTTTTSTTSTTSTMSTMSTSPSTCASTCAPASSSPESSAGFECAQSAARALVYLCDTPSHRLSVLSQGALTSLAPLLSPELPFALRRSALRALHELTRGCGVECARQVVRSGVLPRLGALASGEEEEEEEEKTMEELALKTLANVCAQGCLRPLVGSLGVIRRFCEEVKKDALKSSVFFKALCLCCKEAVNRAKVKDCGGLELLTGFISTHQDHPLSRMAIWACVDFVFDEVAMETLQEAGLVAALVERLVRLCKGSQLPPGDVARDCMDSFDFPPPEEKKETLCSSSFLSLRSWLLSEGLISSEGDLLDSSSTDRDTEWNGLHLSSASPANNATTTSNATTAANVNATANTATTATPITSSTGESERPSPTSTTTANAATTTATITATATTPTSSTSLKPPLPSPVSSTPNTLDSTCKNPSSTTSSSAPVSSSPKTPVSPSKFKLGSPQRRKQRDRASILKLPIETPPSVSRPPSYHPYHPEPWTPESPILLLLSRFSHVSDPSAALVNTAVMSALLLYLTSHPDPSARCFRLLLRLSENPNCLQALVKSGAAAMMHYQLCGRGEGGRATTAEGEEREEPRQSARVKEKVRQLGHSLLSNLQLQSEGAFGAGVLSHLLLSGSESDRLHSALCLPLLTSNKALLKKLLLDRGGLQFALQPLGGDTEGDSPKCPLLYLPLLAGCLTALTSGLKPTGQSGFSLTNPDSAQISSPPIKKPRLAPPSCPYRCTAFDLSFLLDGGERLPANRDAVSGDDGSSEYFRALLKGGFGEASSKDAIAIKDVSAVMLAPALHHLHGCRFIASATGKCQTLDALVHGEMSENGKRFEETRLGKAMVGACRFLVTDLQKELEEVCVALLTSGLENFEKDKSDSEINLSPNSKSQKPKCSDKTSPKNVVERSWILTRLPQMYWFSQRYSYSDLGRTCLSVLMVAPFSQAQVAEGLRNLVQEADCVQTLKLDLVRLVTEALSCKGNVN